MYTAAQHNVTVKITGISKKKSTCSHIEPSETHMSYNLRLLTLFQRQLRLRLIGRLSTWQMCTRTRATREEKNIAFAEREDKKKTDENVDCKKA